MTYRARGVAVTAGLFFVLLISGPVAQATAAPVAPQVRPPGGGTCATVTFVGARGSGESFNTYGGLGPAVYHMSAVLGSAVRAHGIRLQTVADQYPADSVNDLRPSAGEIALLLVDPAAAAADYATNNLGKYLRSINVGISDASGLAREVLDSCPHTKLVMAGYSQGAMVIHQAELRLARFGPKISGHIVGTLLLGDGDRVPHTRAHEFGSSLARAEGIRTYLHGIAPHDVAHPATTANICNAGDLVCDFNLDRVLHFSAAAKVHTSYAVQTKHGVRYSPILAQAARWLARLIISGA